MASQSTDVPQPSFAQNGVHRRNMLTGSASLLALTAMTARDAAAQQPAQSPRRKCRRQKDEVDPIQHLVSAAATWGGNSRKDAVYLTVTPPNNGWTVVDMKADWRTIFPPDGMPVAAR